MQTTAIHHSIFYFSSFSMFTQSRISKSIVICSFCSFLFFYPLYHFHPTLFYSSFYSLFCFLPVYSLYFLISLIVFFSDLLSFVFSLFLLLYSACFSLMLYSYSICSLSISLHPFRSLYIILLYYLFCSCLFSLYFFFLVRIYDTSCSVFLFFLSLSFSLYSCSVISVL